MKLAAQCLRLLLVGLLIPGIYGCISGGEGGTGARKIVSSGRITEAQAGQVAVNGITFNTSKAIVERNGNRVANNQLQLGVIVTIEGVLAANQKKGEADRISLSESLVGAVDQVNGNQLQILGQTVKITENTVTDSSLNPGDFIEVSGFVEDLGIIVATRIQHVDSINEQHLFGVASKLDSTAGTFFIGTIQVDYSGLTMGGNDDDNNDVVEGSIVEVVGTLMNDGVLKASELHQDRFNFNDNAADSFEFEGVVTTTPAQGSFSLGYMKVTFNANTRFFGGRAQDIFTGVHITVEGKLVNGVIQATEIDFQEAFKLVAEVSGVDGQNISFTGLNLNVEIDDKTDFTGTSLNTMATGDWLQVRGRNKGSGIAVALAVTPMDTQTQVTLRGRVQSLKGDVLSVAGITIDSSQVQVSTSPDNGADDEDGFQFEPLILSTTQGIQVGNTVTAYGDLSMGQIQWTSIVFDDN